VSVITAFFIAPLQFKTSFQRSRQRQLAQLRASLGEWIGVSPDYWIRNWGGELLVLISLFGAISVAASVLLLPDDLKGVLLTDQNESDTVPASSTPSITANFFQTVSHKV
jgi:hypothetical protein